MVSGSGISNRFVTTCLTWLREGRTHQSADDPTPLEIMPLRVMLGADSFRLHLHQWTLLFLGDPHLFRRIK